MKDDDVKRAIASLEEALAKQKQKPWVGLNQQDALELLEDGYSTEHTFTQAVRLIEAVEVKLKEKNT